ncbi:zinc transport system substrate-binding protein [Cytobacillus eiseniae]|uniref:Zinc transport system substrate-binding protein n=1 Tax=Cytobacillus eiseniae TaxID=762947 RepID=A0ABS4RMJ9_9BACI|nr:zinc ABC transporter substrate-binding protein [Cytobacillus eiseniae]MBP2243032.1 zinc transport system substrate-binding protein [Cytobacillus eiseniae]
MKKLVLFLILLTVLVGCTNTSDEEVATETDNQKLSIYTTVYPLQYFTDRIGGDYVETSTVYPPGSDEHSFEPTQKDMIKLAEADLFIYVGLGLEGFVEKTQKTLANEEVVLLAAGENVQLLPASTKEEDHHDHEHDHEDGHHHGDIDPHVWLDPLYAKDLAEEIKQALIKKMPEQQENFEANYQQLASELEKLDADFSQTIQEAKHKEIIVSHSAYGYWEERYGLKQISISGLNSSDEPTQKDLEKIIAEGKKQQLKYVFFEQNVSTKLTEIIQKELGAAPQVLHNLSVLTNEDIKNQATYFSIMEANLKALNTALNE